MCTNYFLSLFCLLLLCMIEFDRVDAEACRTMCYNDKSPRCKVVIDKDSMKDNQGIYKLQHGVINMTCGIVSLPTPVEILWKYRPKYDSKYIDVPCGNEQKTEQCNINEFGEHYTIGHCSVRANHLTLSGFYRCEAVQSHGLLVSSNESDIEVVGIELVKKTNERLIVGRDGYVDVKVCANPHPELFWILPKGEIVQPGESRSRFSASQVWPELSKASYSDMPSTKVPYCYRNRLIIGSVSQEDKEIYLIVRNEGETQTTKFDLKIKSSSHVLIPPTIACYIVLALCIFTMNK